MSHLSSDECVTIRFVSFCGMIVMIVGIAYMLGTPTDPRVKFICKWGMNDRIEAIQACAEAATKIDWSKK